MCQKLKTLSQNKYGGFYYSSDCNTYHLVFRNFHIVLNEKEAVAFKSLIHSIDVAYWEDQFSGTIVKRKIPIYTCQENLILIFDKQEFTALKSLFYNKPNALTILSVEDIEYNYSLN